MTCSLSPNSRFAVFVIATTVSKSGVVIDDQKSAKAFLDDLFTCFSYSTMLLKPLKGRRKHLFLSYLKDWILVIILIVVFLVIDSVDPFYSEFPLQNHRLMYSLKNDTLSIGVLAVSCRKEKKNAN